MPLICKRRISAGFTIIELMIVIVIAGILAAMAFPQMRAFIDNARIKTQASDLVGNLMYARSEAVKRGARVVLCKSSNSQSATPACSTDAAVYWEAGWIMFVDSDENNSYAASEIQLRAGDALTGNNTLRVNVAGMANYASVRPDGLIEPSSPQPIFSICDSRGVNYARGVAIEATGRPILVRNNAGIACP